MITLYVPAGVTSVSTNGVEFTPAEDGSVEVPESAVAELLEHGLTYEPPVVEEADEASGEDTAPPRPRRARR